MSCGGGDDMVNCKQYEGLLIVTPFYVRVKSHEREHLMIRLPNELVLQVFENTLDSSCDPFLFTITRYYFLHSFSFLIFMSSVCRSWRSVGINAPQLWTSILVSPKLPLVISELFFNRSGTCLVDVTLEFLHVYDVGDTYIRQATQLVASHLLRTRALAATFRFMSAFDIAAHAFATVSTPNLQSAALTLLYGHPWNPPADGHSSILANAGHLKLQGICLRCAPPLKNLTHLDICGFNPTRLEFSMLFTDCPLLETLVLHDFECCQSDESEVSSPIVAPSLRTLAISFGLEHVESSCPCPFALLSTPKLEYLEISDPSSSLQLRDHFANLSTQHVRHLVLQGVVIGMKNAEFYHSFSEISQLDVLKTVGDVDFLTRKWMANGTMIPLSEFPFPRLVSITFESFSPSRDLRWLLETAAACIADRGQFSIEVPASNQPELADMSELLKQCGDLLKTSFFDSTPVRLLDTPDSWDEMHGPIDLDFDSWDDSVDADPDWEDYFEDTHDEWEDYAEEIDYHDGW